MFVSRAVLRIRSRNQAKQQGEGEGQEQGQGQLQQQPAPQCARYVGLQYLQAIRESRVALCVPPSQQGQAGGGGDGGRRRSLDFRSSRSGRSSLGDGGFGEQALWGGQGEGVSGAEDWHPLHSHSLSHSRSQSQSHSHSHGLRHLSEAAGKGKDEAEPEEPEARGRAGAAAALPAAEGGSRTKRRRRRLEKRGGSGGGADGDDDVGGPLPATESSVDCYTAPFVRAGDSAKATVSLCRSRNLLLNSCELFAFRRPGTLSKKFPAPAAGAVRLACEMRDGGAMAAEDPGALGFLRSMNSAVWWANATRVRRWRGWDWGGVGGVEGGWGWEGGGGGGGGGQGCGGRGEVLERGGIGMGWGWRGVVGWKRWRSRTAGAGLGLGCLRGPELHWSCCCLLRLAC